MMFKALLKKQFLELCSVYFIDRSTGKRKSKEKIVLSIALFAFLFIYLAGVFGALSYSVAEVLIPQGLAWLYFLLISGISLLFGIFGSVFNTYASIYNAKDNDLLLSMPIPPLRILSSRMLGVWGMVLFTEALIYLPAVVIYWILGGASLPHPVLAAVSQLFFFAFLSFLTLALTCLFGWVVALIAGKVKNKSFATVLLSVIAIVAYFFCINKSQTLIEKFLTEAGDIGENLRRSAYPIYAFGTAATGNLLALAFVALLSLVALALTVYLLAKSFFAIINTKKGIDKKKYEKKTLTKGSVLSALLKKEFRHYLSSANYILNASIGTIMIPIAAIALIFKRENIPVLLSLLQGKERFLPVVAALFCIMFTAMNTLSASSVSLEGKTVWILQSLPMDYCKVFQSKIYLHLILTVPPILFAVIVLVCLLPMSVAESVLLIVFSILYVVFSAEIGLLFNLVKPNLHWTNEVVPVKQGLPVCFVLLGGWALGVTLGAGYFFLYRFLAPWIYLLLMIFATSIGIYLTQRWLKNKGTDIFAYLQ